ncbi:uncharacterized protein LOC135206342 [Macrobrachium nipponense]|uniref:uncharacterized protein LOC135206342 n=1 Tax=Macrobrachium nipponense TaxID=159736 RepID=UPI0030C8503A
MKLVPDFTDYDPEDYFSAFEETASHLNWPKEQWIWLLRPKLSGKAAQVCRHIKETNDYEVIKKAVIDAFSISVEGYRQVFRNKVKTSTQTYLEFASEKLRDFRKWLKASTITTFEQLENLIVFEEFVRKLPSHIMLYLCDRQENDLLKAASLADTYSLVHKTSKRLDHIVKQVPGNTLGVSTEESRESLLCKYCRVSVGVVDNDFPVEGVSFLLGNDLAGNLVVPNLVVTDHPSEGNDFSNDVACVITRSQKSKDLECSEVIENAVENIMSKAELIKAQKQDDTLSNFHSQAVSKCEIDKSPSFYYESGVLMRFYRPAKLSKLDTWGEKHQIVLPSSVRKLVLEVAHDGNGGHLGIHKTYHKILNHFYWPNMKKDIADFIRTCHICQISGKPNQSIPKYPLQPIVVPDDPFHRVIIDCVGPLPKTKKGHQYLLTIMCPTTRYPIAIPLRNILAKTIANALLKVFTTYGIPRELQCDRGSNFTSDLFGKVLKELEIKQILSSAYHPESQGVLERWHQTFKSMLKKYCLENNAQWDEGVDFLLFAIREAPQESLGFSPFEMLFGRSVRGPLSVIKDEWLSAPSSSQIQSVKQYMSKLQKILCDVRKLVKENLEARQLEMKTNFDRSSKVRKLLPGDLVLAYFPVHSSPLKSKFFGPYKVLKNVNNNTYVIETPDRRKSTQIVHINLLKKYHCREPGPCSRDLVVNMINIDSASENTSATANSIDDLIPSWSPESNSEVLQNLEVKLSHLPSEHSQRLQTLINNVSFCDFPRKSTVLLHDIELVPGTMPIRQPPYRLSPDRKAQMKREVEYLLKHGLAVPSKSPWASPCLLVPKEDGNLRFCTDYSAS